MRSVTIVVASLFAAALPVFAQVLKAPPAAPAKAQVQPLTPAAAAAQQKKQLQQYVEDALQEALPGLSPTPAQKKIFDDEAVADATAFVTNYSTNGEGTSVQIDKDKLGQFLRFEASLYAGSVVGAKPRLCVRVRPEQGCGACKRLAASLEDLMNQRFTKRGFTAVAGPQLPAESELTGDSAFEDYSARATEAHCDGALYGEVTQERSADSDDEDPDIRLTWTAQLSLRALSGRKIRAHSQAGGAVKRDSEGDGYETSMAEARVLASRATADLFAAAAGSAGTGGSMNAGVTQETEESYLRLTGITNYGVYAKFKDVASTLPGLKLEERLLTPGAISFAVPQGTNLEEVSRALQGANWGGQTLKIVSSTATELEVALK